MSVTLQRLEQVTAPELATTLRNAGVDGAGGAGFPAYAKWEHLDEVDSLLVNHQESEPNYYIDKWLANEHAGEFAALFEALLERAFETIVVGAKQKDRERWMRRFEEATDATVYTPEELPLDIEVESGVVFAYTEDRYEYGMESVLLQRVADTVVGKDLPVDHGWIVQNTETLYNIYRALDASEPVTHKYLHVDGNVPRHRFLHVPVGTTAEFLFETAGKPPTDLTDDEMLVDGGPGWCFEVEDPPERFGIRKRTNCVLAVDVDDVDENKLGADRINLLDAYDWDREHETEPTTLEPATVRVPLITNPAFEGVVEPSVPIVEPGDDVTVGEMVAVPASEGISNAQHASIDGEVTEVTDVHVEIRGATEDANVIARDVAEAGRILYWTWCAECGAYETMTEMVDESTPAHYLCEECRSD